MERIFEKEPIPLTQWTRHDFIQMERVLKQGAIAIIHMDPAGTLRAKVWPGEVFIIQRKEVS